MRISEKISDDLKTALKAGDKARISILRMVKAEIKNREIEKRSELTDEEIQSVLRSFVKKANESIEQFAKAGREELALKERDELSVLQAYLPQQLQESEIRDIIRAVIAEVGATGTKDLGRVMKAVMARTSGKADGKMVNNLVKEILESSGAA